MKKVFLTLCLTAVLATPSCFKVDNSLGKGLVDKSLLFDTYTAEFPLEEIQLKASEALSGYSDTRITIGAIRDEYFGLTTREAAFNLIPALDTLDLGTNPKAVSLVLNFAQDTVSCADDSQARIFQSIYVTELTKTLPTADDDTRNTQEIPHGSKIITKGLVSYNGQGDLTFDLSQEYAQKYVDAIVSTGKIFKDRDGDTDKYDEFIAKMPGIHLRTNVPEGIGGRINMFDFSCLSVSSNYYVRNNNVGVLTVNSTWNGVQKDSTFIVVPGETELINESEYLAENTKFYQYCFNRTTQSTTAGPAVGKIVVEGGGGLKPVILATELVNKTCEAIAAKGGVPSKAVIVKASIVLPFEMPEDYQELKYYPSILSPTIQTTYETETGVERPSFAGLTDASISTEDQGDIDRSNLVYKPDITYHLQELLSRTNLNETEDADIWLLTIHTEQVANASGSLYDNEYYQNLLYASYYNSIYGGGYGGYGYGSYGYGGYGYSNYYNYMMLASMMSASTEQTYTTTTELDKDRYYRAILCGYEDERHPIFRVTFALPKD
jgi:hypothetical protein